MVSPNSTPTYLGISESTPVSSFLISYNYVFTRDGSGCALQGLCPFALERRGFTEMDYKKSLKCLLLVHIHFLNPVSEPGLNLESQPRGYNVAEVNELFVVLGMHDLIPLWQRVWDPTLKPLSPGELPFHVATSEWIAEDHVGSLFV